MPDPCLRRIEGCRSASAARLTLQFDGRDIAASAGESIAAALAAAGIRATRRTGRFDDPRGYYCGMGVCWECVVDIEGVGQRRACMVAAEDGMTVRSVVAGVAS